MSEYMVDSSIKPAIEKAISEVKELNASIVDDSVEASTETSDTETAEVVEETPVEMKEVCGISVPVNCIMTDDEITAYDEKVKTFTKLEVVRGLQKLKNDAELSVVLGEYIETSKITVENITELLSSFDTVLGVESLNTEKIVKAVEEAEASEDDEPLDFDSIKKELNEYRERIDVSLKIMQKRYDEIKKSGSTTITEDIIETLLKNRDTINKSDSLNKELYSRNIDKVIDEFQSGGSILHLTRMWPKLQSDKRILELITEVAKDVPRAIKEVFSIGFTHEFFKNFIEFLNIEHEFIVYKLSNTTDSEADAEEYDYSAVFQSFTLVFFYHIAKIVKSEVKKQNYLSLIFKCYVLQALELSHILKDSFKLHDEDLLQKRLDAEKDSDLYKASQLRLLTFAEYDKLIRAYSINGKFARKKQQQLGLIYEKAKSFL